MTGSQSTKVHTRFNHDSKRCVCFTLPQSFQPAEYLPLRLLTRADDARWLVSSIVKKNRRA